MERRRPRRAVGADERAGGALPALPAALAGHGLSLFELDNVSLARGGARVLTGLDLEIGHGATALLGRSGSGKSTVLRLLNRLVDPDEGVVRFHGDDVRSLDPLELRRRAVLVPQLPAPLPGSVADNVLYGPRLAGRTARVEPCLRSAGLDASYADREAARLSVGEQQRVMLARALALDPEVLLLDEPTSALDERARDEVEGTLARLDRSFVLVTHDPAQAERLTERVVQIG